MQENTICPQIQLLLEAHNGTMARFKDFESMKAALTKVKSEIGVMKVVITQHDQSIHELTLVK